MVISTYWSFLYSLSPLLSFVESYSFSPIFESGIVIFTLEFGGIDSVIIIL